MTRKTGMLVLAALAVSVALLGLLMAARCERVEGPTPGRVDTLTVGGVAHRD